MSALGKAMGLDTDKIAHDWLPVANRAVTALEKFVDAYAEKVQHERKSGRSPKA